MGKAGYLTLSDTPTVSVIWKPISMKQREKGTHMHPSILATHWTLTSSSVDDRIFCSIWVGSNVIAVDTQFDTIPTK